jgi:hypothetical protein
MANGQSGLNSEPEVSGFAVQAGAIRHSGVRSLPACESPASRRQYDQTQPVGLANPATLQAPFAGPEGNISYISLSENPDSLQSLRIMGAIPNFA